MAGGHTTRLAAGAGGSEGASLSLQRLGLLQGPAEECQHTRVHLDESICKYKI